MTIAVVRAGENKWAQSKGMAVRKVERTQDWQLEGLILMQALSISVMNYLFSVDMWPELQREAV